MRTLGYTAGRLLTISLLALGGCGGEAERVDAVSVEAPSPVSNIAPSDAEDPRCRLATVDSVPTGECPEQGDGDHDGVDDGTDLCPDTTPGIEVDSSGCALAVKPADPGAL